MVVYTIYYCTIYNKIELIQRRITATQENSKGMSTTAEGWIQGRSRISGGRASQCSWAPLAGVVGGSGGSMGGGLVPGEAARYGASLES